MHSHVYTADGRTLSNTSGCHSCVAQERQDAIEIKHLQGLISREDATLAKAKQGTAVLRHCYLCEGLCSVGRKLPNWRFRNGNTEDRTLFALVSRDGRRHCDKEQ